MKVIKAIGIIVLIILGAWAANENQKQNAKRAIYEIQREQRK